jgi:hypothetical protein
VAEGSPFPPEVRHLLVPSSKALIFGNGRAVRCHLGYGLSTGVWKCEEKVLETLGEGNSQRSLSLRS